MAVSLRITDGSDTVILTGTDALFERYQPVGYTPDGVFQWSPQGGELIGLEHNNVTESIPLQLISTSNINTIRDTQRTLVRLLQQAARRQAYPDAVPPVYIEIQLDYDGTDWWRSEILAGKLRPGELLFDTDWLDKDVAFTLEFTRRNYWEGPQTNIEASSKATAATTGFVTVYNTTDNQGDDPPRTDRGCYVDIPAEQVTGDLPAPPIVHVNEPLIPIYRIWVFNNVYSSPLLLTHIYEGEDAAQPAVGVLYSTTNDPSPSPEYDYSGYDAVLDATLAEALANPGTFTSGTVLRWTPTAATLKGAGVRSFHVFVHGDSIGRADMKLRVRLDSGGAISYPSETPLGTGIPSGRYQILYLGVITLPPVPITESLLTNTAWTLDLYAENMNMTDITIDYIALFPADSLSFYNAPKAVSSGLGQTDILIDDQINDILDVEDEGSQGFIREGRLHLIPGVNQRIYFQFGGNPDTGFGSPAMNAGIRFAYRPRRSII